MKTYLVAAAMAMTIGLQAQAEELIHSVEINKLDSVELLNFGLHGWESDCTLLDRSNQLRPAIGDIDLTDIINVGEKIWEIVKENEPILEARGAKASALPRGITCWDQLTSWSPTRAETYEVVYKNLYGMRVVDLKFRILYTYGGQLKGQGRYLTNSTIQFSKVNVLWGYIFNADVEIPQVVNMGTEENPLAGMQMTLNWSVNTRPISLKKSINSASFFVSGDGRPTKILD